MAAKKKTTKTKAPKEDKPKCKGLFDHLNAVFTSRDPAYFKTLSDADKRTWSNYMIHRFVSMNPDYLEIVNYIQKYSKLPPEMLYRFYTDLIPRARQFNKYVKSAKSDKYGDKAIELVATYFVCSRKEATEYMDILTEEQITDICKKFGMNKKELKSALEV